MIVFMRCFLFTFPMSGLYRILECNPVPPAVWHTRELRLHRVISLFQLLSFEFNLNYAVFLLILSPLSPGTSFLKRAPERHLSSAQRPLVTPWRRGRFTPLRLALCPETACPEGLSSSRSRLSIAPGSAPPWLLWGSLWFCPSFSATA